MSYPERFCPACESAVKDWPFRAPADHYRCWNCLEATPFKDLPERVLLRVGQPIPEPVPPVRISPYQRFYFTRDGANPGFTSPVDPALAAWDDITQAGFNSVGVPVGNPWKMLTVKSAVFNPSGTEAFTATVGVANFKTLILAYVSDQIEAGTISGTVKGQMRWLQDFADCAQDRVTIALSVVSGDGLTNRGYLLPLGFYGTTSLFQTSPGDPQNRFLANGDAMTPVVAQNGDRLFLEIGSQPSAAPTLGDFVSCYLQNSEPNDLPEDETSTLAYSPWIELIP